MTQAELEALVRGMAPAIRAEVAKEVRKGGGIGMSPQEFADMIGEAIQVACAPLLARIKALEARPAAISYEGVWDAKQMYVRGQFVTHDGSLWHCNEPSINARPGTSGTLWTLAVKRGKDAR